MTALHVLYSFRRCPYAMRARLAVAASGRSCQLREVVLRNKPAAMLQASPKGTVPVLVPADGPVIDESLDIMLWALRRNDPQQWLQPESGSPDDAFGLVAECDGPFKQNLDRYKYPPRYPDADPQACRDAAAAWLAGLNQRLTKTPFLMGNRASIADVAIFPFVRQFAHTDKEWFSAQAWQALTAWLNAWLQHPLFEQVMVKVPAWQEGQAVVVFPGPGDAQGAPPR